MAEPHAHRWVLTAARRRRRVARTEATFGCALEGCAETWRRTFYGAVPVYSSLDRRLGEA